MVEEVLEFYKGNAEDFMRDGFRSEDLDGYFITDTKADLWMDLSVTDWTPRKEIVDWMYKQDMVCCVIDGKNTWFDTDSEVQIYEIVGITSNYTNAVKMCNMLTIMDYTKDKDTDLGRYYVMWAIDPKDDESRVRYEMFRAGADGYAVIEKALLAMCCTHDLLYLQKHDPEHVYGLRVMSSREIDNINHENRVAHNEDVCAEAYAMSEICGGEYGADHYLSEAASCFSKPCCYGTAFIRKLEENIERSEKYGVTTYIDKDKANGPATSWADRK